MIRLRATAASVYGDNFYVPLPDAWRFDTAGCQAGMLELGAEFQKCFFFGSGTKESIETEYDGYDLHITMTFRYDVILPAPDVVYVLGQLAYDHSRSAADPQDPAVACGEAERDVCFIFEDAQWFSEEGNSHPISFEFFKGIYWQEGRCFYDLPVVPATWGSIKAIYR